MNEITKNLLIFIFSLLFLGIIIAVLSGFCIRLNDRLSVVTNDKTELTESNRISIELVDNLKQKLRDRDARIERDKGIIETLQANLKKSKEDIRELGKNRNQFDAANRRLAEYERRERDRERERNRIIDELRKGIVDLKGDIEKIPTEAVD